VDVDGLIPTDGSFEMDSEWHVPILLDVRPRMKLPGRLFPLQISCRLPSWEVPSREFFNVPSGRVELACPRVPAWEQAATYFGSIVPYY